MRQSSRRQNLKQALPVGSAEACAGVPTCACFVVAIVSLRDVAERGAGRCGVEQGIDEAGGLTEALIDASD